MSWTLKTLMLPLMLLCLWQLQQEGAHACRCPQLHLQQAFCQADVVIKAMVVGVTVGGGFKPIKYDIKLSKLFKGPRKNFDSIYTASSSASCGITLTNGVNYLLMGRLQSDGSLHISSCDFFKRWQDLSIIQKGGVLQCYQKGCDCKPQIAR
ncbi:metalloproteinase inhibitor 2-like [Phyllopteryx taeniolatus]|uniref:metalloproteinase inhibitor 2-like n=1 Tax=Phyllopteryx taeniolatus TaxID=161469 RepID=UPI002AD50BE1|nr:metalloproteinase inhibitor 2-like [Phyllopteryx taeniolatus]